MRLAGRVHGEGASPEEWIVVERQNRSFAGIVADRKQFIGSVGLGFLY